MSSNHWLEAAAAGATIIAAAPILHRFTKPFRDSWRKFKVILDDWGGEPARPGVPRRPGVMERLESHDNALGNVRSEVNEVRAELDEVRTSLKPNGGKSLYDGMNRVHEAVTGGKKIEDGAG